MLSNYRGQLNVELKARGGGRRVSQSDRQITQNVAKKAKNIVLFYVQIIGKMHFNSRDGPDIRLIFEEFNHISTTIFFFASLQNFMSL